MPTKSTEDFDRLLELVSATLNELHGTRHNERYWGILLYRYLNKCVNAEGYGLPAHPFPESPKDDNDVLGARIAETEPAGADDPPRVQPRPLFGRLSRIRQWRSISRERDLLNAMWSTELRGSPSVLGGFHYYHVIVQRVDQPASVMLPERLKQDVTNDPTTRQALSALARSVDWPLGRRALDWMPRYYVEEFRSRSEGVVLESPERRTIHAAFLPFVEARFYVAHHVAAGSTLTMYQHAGYYGEVPWTLHHAEATLADRFCTWGWKLYPRDEPFLALRLMKPAGEAIRFRARASDWLYVNTLQPFPYLVDETLGVQSRFFATLSETRARRIVVRARVNKGGSVNRQVGPQARRVVRVDDGTRSWREALETSAVVILDHFPTTSFLECIVAGIPVVAIMPPSTTFTSVARPFYERFIDAGVLHRTPESAATFLNDVSPYRWWQGVVSTDWFSDYRRTFCRIDDFH